MARASEMIGDVLVEAGIEYVFGIPGGATGPFFQALYDRQEKIKTILVRHEQAAACAADLYGRMTGKPAVITGQGLWMGSNASFGIMEAFASNSPMLVLTDTSENLFPQYGVYQVATGDYGSVDLPNIFRCFSKYVTVATTPKEAVHGVQLAIKHATTGRMGPAVVLFRTGSLTGEPDINAPPRYFPTAGYLNTAKPAAREADVARAAQILISADSPVIVAGNGVHMAKAYAELQEMAELLGAPVATSYKGKSTLPETHPLALGMMGAFGQKAANSIVGEADAILAIGCKLEPTTSAYEDPSIIDPTRQRIVQIDIDSRNAGWCFPVELGLVGDAKVVLGQLVATTKEALKGTRIDAATRTETIVKLKKELDFFSADVLCSESVPIYPQRLVRELQETLDPSAIICLDAGANRVWPAHFFQTKQVGTWWAPGGVAGMGWAAPAALAAQIVHPDRHVVAIAGDGGFAMTSHAVSTACQYGLPITFVVQNDSALSWIRSSQGERQIAVNFIDTNFAKLADGFGARGFRTDNPADVKLAIKDAAKSKVPTVIDVLIDQTQALASIRRQMATARAKK